jgi:hypothetical protein
MINSSSAAEGSHGCDNTPTSISFPNRVTETQQLFGVVEDRQFVVDALVRIANALENQSRSTIQALPPKALSFKDAARYAGMEEKAIKEQVRTGRLAFVQYGSQRGRMILIKDLDDFLVKHRQSLAEVTRGKRRHA